MAQFHKYPKLEHYNKSNIPAYIGKYIYVTEKIHGSNFQIYINVDKNDKIKDYRYGRRTGFIDYNENFFGCKITMSKYETKLKNMALQLGEGVTIIYGEYYGGYCDGKTITGCYSVQNGPYANYSSENKFKIFDIVHDNEFLLWDKVKELCFYNNLEHVPEIMRGIYPDILEGFDVETLKSIVSESEQLAEGIVINTLDNSVDFKMKWVATGMKEKPRIKKHTVSVNSSVKIDYEGYMNQNRFDKYLSKVGPDLFKLENIGKIIKELVLDALDDIKSDNLYHNEKEEAKIRKILSGPARRLAITYINSI
jgi:Rnl2 family RNA ligase